MFRRTPGWHGKAVSLLHAATHDRMRHPSAKTRSGVNRHRERNETGARGHPLTARHLTLAWSQTCEPLAETRRRLNQRFSAERALETERDAQAPELVDALAAEAASSSQGAFPCLPTPRDNELSATNVISRKGGGHAAQGRAPAPPYDRRSRIAALRYRDVLMAAWMSCRAFTPESSPETTTPMPTALACAAAIVVMYGMWLRMADRRISEPSDAD